MLLCRREDLEDFIEIGITFVNFCVCESFTCVPAEKVSDKM